MVRLGSRRVGVQCMQAVRDILLAQPMEGTREIPGATLRLECRERAGLCISAGALTTHLRFAQKQWTNNGQQ
jgi:hypothetical protein